METPRDIDLKRLMVRYALQAGLVQIQALALEIRTLVARAVDATVMVAETTVGAATAMVAEATEAVLAEAGKTTYYNVLTAEGISAVFFIFVYK